jgi:hypothetical protein
MTKYALIPVGKSKGLIRSTAGLCVAGAFLILAAACSNPVKSKLQGNWKSKDGETQLKINDKKFAMDSDLPLAEDYFVKGDTIFTSFEGNQPYTKFIVQKLENHYLKLLSPDSLVMEFTR